MVPEILGFTKTYFELIGTGLEMVGVAIIVLGAVFSTVVFLVKTKEGYSAKLLYQLFRRQFGKSILLGLEFLVAGDIANTVGVEPSFTSLGMLSIIVFIRTFLSFTLEVEMSGYWPWQKKEKQM